MISFRIKKRTSRRPADRPPNIAAPTPVESVWLTRSLITERPFDRISSCRRRRRWRVTELADPSTDSPLAQHSASTQLSKAWQRHRSHESLTPRREIETNGESATYGAKPEQCHGIWLHHGIRLRDGIWLRVAEQSCLALLSAVLIAMLMGWLAICHWQRQQRIDLKAIESEEVRFYVDPNQAATDELQLLPGIGPTLASRILESRHAQGEFKSVEDLQRVRGIGERTVHRIAPYIAIHPSTGRSLSP